MLELFCQTTETQSMLEIYNSNVELALFSRREMVLRMDSNALMAGRRWLRQGHEAAHVGPQPLDGRHQAQDVLQLLVALGAARAVRLGGVERCRARGGAGGDVGEILRDVGEVHVAAQLAVAVELQLRLRQDHVYLREVLVIILVVHLGRH
jgi:hypothetical protein